jgi:hypothetical protein
LLALLGAHPILHISRIRVKWLKLRFRHLGHHFWETVNFADISVTGLAQCTVRGCCDACPNFYSILLSHLEVNGSQITTLPRYRYALQQHVWKFPEIHGSLKEDYIQIQLFSKHGCEGLSECLKYTSFVTELIKNIRTENMSQQKGAQGQLQRLRPNTAD